MMHLMNRAIDETILHLRRNITFRGTLTHTPTLAKPVLDNLRLLSLREFEPNRFRSHYVSTMEDNQLCSNSQNYSKLLQ